MKIGNQNKYDNKFKAAARLHQSKHRAEILQVGCDGYGNILTAKDAQKSLNYYDGLNCRSELRKRYPKYAKMRDANMLRSEHIPFNFFAPFDKNKDLAKNILKYAFNIECSSIESVDIEYKPKPKEKYLNDNTSFDTYLRVRLPNKKKCGIGIEVKYTERHYCIGKTEAANIKNRQSLYWQTTKNSNCFIDPGNNAYGSNHLRQIWRNHLLGLSMVQHNDIDEFYAITLFPNGNNYFHKVLPEYTSLLVKDAKHFVFGCTFEKYISSIGGTSEFDEWKAWLKKRYLFE